MAVRLRSTRLNWILLAIAVVVVIIINVPLVQSAATAGTPGDSIVDEEFLGSTVRDLIVYVDTATLAALLLWWRFRFRRRDRRDVETVSALEDLRPGRIRAVWQDLGDGTVRVSGTVLEHDEHEVLLDAGDRLVRVVLDGRFNFVSDREPAQLRATRWSAMRPTPDPIRSDLDHEGLS